MSIERCSKAILYIGIDNNNKQNIENNEILIKLIYFLEKLGQTKGLKSVSLKSGNVSIQKDFFKIVQQIKNKITLNEKVEMF